MIRIARRSPLPVTLATLGTTEASALRAARDADPAGYAAGKPLEFKSDIYGAADVKAALLRDQHDKCAFCESRVRHIDFGDVEHFRPKAGFTQRPGDPLTRPGYYWLAYDWDNLLLACTMCNQRHKRNLFPLRKAIDRCRSHHDHVRIPTEGPLFINPVTEDPAAHLYFVGASIFWRAGDRRGKATVESLGLRRRKLRLRRWERLADLRALKDARDQLANLPARSAEQAAALEAVESRLKAAVQDRAEYAAMARAFLR